MFIREEFVGVRCEFRLVAGVCSVHTMSGVVGRLGGEGWVMAKGFGTVNSGEGMGMSGGRARPMLESRRWRKFRVDTVVSRKACGGRGVRISGEEGIVCGSVNFAGLNPDGFGN